MGKMTTSPVVIKAILPDSGTVVPSKKVNCPKGRDEVIRRMW